MPGWHGSCAWRKAILFRRPNSLTDMKRPLGTAQSVLLSGRPVSKRFVEMFGVADFHSHFRWHAIERYIDWSAARTLEVGANSGVMTFEIAPRLRGGRIVASEFDPVLLALAQRIKQLGNYDNVTLGQADLRELALAGEMFDQALAIDVLEHIDDHEAAVRQLVAAMRVGGRLVVSVPTPNYADVFGRDFHDKIGHVREGYWFEDLARLLEPAGFRIDAHHYYTGRLASIGCSMHYRDGRYRRLMPERGQVLAAPFWRRLAMLGERNVPRQQAASLALVATKT